ncbi:hypothetical protein DEALK_17470 [Dehalogenimonas alkenigignens]|uniref:Uncharacterized protein n=1 Tax=Dehalogenimonas alkenigignens TaxID=1217799 RepID=A0A0W0GK27_9CHLR|nr:hypothetical protein DEALK_17470 [Dehalogenimonas alkenigignens]
MAIIPFLAFSVNSEGRRRCRIRLPKNGLKDYNYPSRT